MTSLPAALAVTFEDLGGDPFLGPGLDDPGFGTVGSGPPAGFTALLALAVVAGVAVTVWKLVVARQMARGSGHDADRATGMALLTDHGLEAQFLASSLRAPTDAQPPTVTPVPTDPPDRGADGRGAPPARPVADRLRELDDLRTQGLVTEVEHAERRRAILDAL